MNSKHLLFFLVFFPEFLTAQILPASFDLRNYNGNNYVTSVKAQQGGTCWTHGALAAIEGNLLMTGVWQQAGEQGEPDLSEYHLDWWNGFNQHNNDDINPPTGNGLVVHNGGDYRVTAAYLSRGEGAVREIDASSFATPPLRSDTSYHYFYARDIEWYTTGTGLERINTIKQKLMTEGIVGTSMCVGGFWSAGNIHYQPPSDLNDPNHAVAIIGWDDSMHTPAENPGAWLCKNSWGAAWGNNGYFWISYYDKHCGQHPQMGAISFQNTEPLQYDKVYFHDYHGWRDELPKCSQAFNRFIASDYGLLKAVSFYTVTDSIHYTVVVYDSISNGVLQNPLSFKSGDINHTGFHTIDLDSLVTLIPSNDFYIYLMLSAGGQAYDKTSAVPVLLGSSSRTIVSSSAVQNESFYMDTVGHWTDLHGIDSTANFCIKGLSTKLLPETSSIPTGNNSICKGEIFTVYQIPEINYASNYFWTISPANAAIITNYDTIAEVHWNSNFTGLAQLSVKGSNNWGYGNTSPSLLIKVNELPNPNIGNDTTILISQSLNLMCNPSFSSYLWSNNSIDSSVFIVATQLGLGTHQVWVTVTDSNGCENSDTLTIQVINDVSAENLNKPDISIYPNPANDFIYVKGISRNNEEDIEMSILSTEGSLVYNQTINSMHEPVIDVSLLPDGFYFIKLISKNQTYFFRFIKQ
jgi:C1A family cysteine protease